MAMEGNILGLLSNIRIMYTCHNQKGQPYGLKKLTKDIATILIDL